MGKAFTVDQAREFAFGTRGKFFIGPEAGKVFSRGFVNKPNIILPGITAVDPTALLFNRRLSAELMDAFPMDVRPDGYFGANGVSTNFQSLNTVSGFAMTPATYTPIGNEELRASLGLAKGFKSTRHEKIFEEMIRLRYAEHSGKRSKISKISGSGFPRFSKSVSHKLDHMSILLNNMPEIRELLMKDDLNRLFSKFAMLFAKKDVYRLQADKISLENGRLISKDREVNDLLYCLSSGKHGQRFVANKLVEHNGMIIPEKYAMRKRTANGIPHSVNGICSAYFEGWRDYGDNTYHKTFKHKTRASIEAKTRERPLSMGLDVTQYDQSVPEWLFDKWLELIPGNEFFKKFVNTLTKSPMFYGGVGSEGDPIWTGDPLDSDYSNQWTGLVSGIFYTSAAGKDFFTWACLCMIDDYYHDVLGRVDEILKWEDPRISISNMGDDTLLHMVDKNLYYYLEDLNETSSYGMSPYFKVDREEGFKFLGNVGYVADEAVDPLPRLSGDLGSYFVNMLVPERSLPMSTDGANSFRKYGVYGLLVRRDVYKDNPSFEKADEIFMKLFKDMFGINFMTLLDDNLIYPEITLEHVTSQADIEVLMDPSKLFYKYDTEDIAPEIVGKIEEQVPQSLCDLAYKHFN